MTPAASPTGEAAGVMLAGVLLAGVLLAGVLLSVAIAIPERDGSEDDG